MQGLSSWISIENPIDVFLSGETKKPCLSNQQIQNEFSKFCVLNKYNPASILWAQKLLIKQEKEVTIFKEILENETIWKTKEELEKDILIHEAISLLYGKLGINYNQSNNNSITNFVKWIVDKLIIWNYDLGIGINIWDILAWNTYERWRSIVTPWFISTWTYGASKWIKFVKKVNERRKNTITHVNSIVLEDDLTKDILWYPIYKKKLEKLESVWSYMYFNNELKQLSTELWLEKRLTLANYVDNWVEAAIFEMKWMQFDGTDMVVKLLKENSEQDILKGLEHHSTFFSIHNEWKKKIYQEMWANHDILIHIPRVKNYKWYYLMENMKDYVSLRTVLQREFLRKEFAAKLHNFDIDDFNSYQLNSLSQKLWVAPFDHDNLNLKWLDKSGFEQIKNFFWYINHIWLYHWDLEWWVNLMIHKNLNKKKMYLIDFVWFKHPVHKSIMKHRENISIKEISNIMSKETWKYTYPVGWYQGHKYIDAMGLNNLAKNLIE
jgi:hypothetical protein